MADIKKEILEEAAKIVNGDRRAAYGTPEDNFGRIAMFWQAYMDATGREVLITAADVSPMMRLMKEARLCESPDHRDSFVDIIGYAMTGAEINLTPQKEDVCSVPEQGPQKLTTTYPRGWWTGMVLVNPDFRTDLAIKDQEFVVVEGYTGDMDRRTIVARDATDEDLMRGAKVWNNSIDIWEDKWFECFYWTGHTDYDVTSRWLDLRGSRRSL